MTRNPLARAASAAGRLSRFALGRYVEVMGNRMRVEGLTLSLDSPAIETSQKGELYFGHHELEERRLVKKWLPKDLPVVEFGGGLGLVSCLINRALARPEDHVVVEANPNLLEVLGRNRDLNGCRFRVVPKAIAYDTDTVELGLGWHFAGTSVGGGEHIRTTTRVPATTLGEVIRDAGFDQISLVSDIEGIEVAMIGASSTPSAGTSASSWPSSTR